MKDIVVLVDSLTTTCIQSSTQLKLLC